MSIRETLARQELIIRKIKNVPVSFDELSNFLRKESELQGYDFNISRRTFQRDLNHIRSLYGTDIQYCRTRGVYYVKEYEDEEVNERMLESFYTFNALSMGEKMSADIHFESRKSLGTENLQGLIRAIKNRNIISFTYIKFYDEQEGLRKIEPYGLKEYRLRWYVVGKDRSDGVIKIFGLDRLNDLIIGNEQFGNPYFDIDRFFKHSFGVDVPPNSNPVKMKLLFTPMQGKYIKTLPLHPSQQIISDDEDGLLVELHIHITHDFIMELLSFGPDVKVLSPQELREDIAHRLTSALEQY